MRRRDRAIGILLGILLGLAIVFVFVFVFSGETIDEPSISDNGGGIQREPPTGPGPARGPSPGEQP